MSTKLLVCMIAALAALTVGGANAAEKGKAKAEAAAESKPEAKAKRDTYPLYGKVSAITSRTLTIVRGNGDDAKEAKYTINSATVFTNGDKPATAEDVKVGRWVGGILKKVEGDGNDVVVKLNVAVKQKEDKPAAEGKGESKSKKGDAK